MFSVVTGRDADMPHAQDEARDDGMWKRFLADLGRIGRQYVARTSEPMRPMGTAGEGEVEPVQRDERETGEQQGALGARAARLRPEGGAASGAGW